MFNSLRPAPEYSKYSLALPAADEKKIAKKDAVF